MHSSTASTDTGRETVFGARSPNYQLHLRQPLRLRHWKILTRSLKEEVYFADVAIGCGMGVPPIEMRVDRSMHITSSLWSEHS